MQSYFNRTTFNTRQQNRKCEKIWTLPLGHQLLQLVVLVFQLPKPLRLAHFQTAVLGLPAVERLFADAMLAA
jgi:hypothetical protein